MMTYIIILYVLLGLYFGWFYKDKFYFEGNINLFAKYYFIMFYWPTLCVVYIYYKFKKQ